jgi:hypothetical protein
MAGFSGAEKSAGGIKAALFVRWRINFRIKCTRNYSKFNAAPRPQLPRLSPA